MTISLKPAHLKRYKDIAQLFLKYGRSDLVKGMGWNVGLEMEPTAQVDVARAARELASDLERLGPTYIKLGQLLSSRSDLLPLPCIEALTRLQDKVEPFPFSEAAAIIGVELGARVSKLFRELDPEPVAAASLGQVHRARTTGLRFSTSAWWPGSAP